MISERLSRKWENLDLDIEPPQHKHTEELMVVRGQLVWAAPRKLGVPCGAHLLVENLGSLGTGEALELQGILGEEGHSQVKIVVPELKVGR